MKNTVNVEVSSAQKSSLNPNGKISSIIELSDLEQGSISCISSKPEEKLVQRGLKSRHLQLIALGGAVGTGLFIGTGSTLVTCGPAPLLIAFIIMSFFIWTIINQLTELVLLAPFAGETSTYAMAKTYINRPVSFMTGWNLFYALAMVAPTEITACTMLVKYWTNANAAIFVTVFVVTTISLSMLPVKVFGESEFCISSIKLVTALGIIILGVVIFFGGVPSEDHVLGFHYWKHPGSFKPYITTGNTGRFCAIWTAIVKSGFAFVLAPETFAQCSAEAQYPRRNMPRACNRFIWRVILFYIGGSLFVGIAVGYDNKRLSSAIAAGSSSGAASPFVVGIIEAGISVLPHIVNACILTAAYSAGTAQLYGTSRMLYSMARKGDAPKIFSKVNRYGTPYFSVGIASCFCLLAYLNCSDSSSQVFTWLSNIATISGFVSWIIVSITYLRYRKVVDCLGLNERIPFRKRLQRFCAYLSTGFFFILSLTNGYSVFTKGNWNVSDFFANYVTIGFISVLFIGGTIYYKEWRFRDIEEVGSEIVPKLDLADEEEKNEVMEEPKNWLEKLWYIIV